MAEGTCPGAQERRHTVRGDRSPGWRVASCPAAAAGCSVSAGPSVPGSSAALPPAPGSCAPSLWPSASGPLVQL